MDDLNTRLAKPEDAPQILEVLRAALGETALLRRTPELWRWKHEDNPFGSSIVLLAESGGRLAGVRALMRWTLVTPAGDEISCVRPVDTATHPDFARRGIFSRLTNEALEVARVDGVQLVFNTPNPKSAAGYLKMGWEHVAWLGVMARPRLGAAFRPRPDEAPSIHRLAPDLADSVPASPIAPQRQPLGLRTPRHDQYMEWRFNQHPTAEYGWSPYPKGGGMIVRASSRGGRSELVVSDLVGSPGPGIVGRTSRSSRARYLAGWFSPGTPERRIAMRGGLLPVPGVKSLRLVARPLVELDIDVHDLTSWDLATSDLELL